MCLEQRPLISVSELATVSARDTNTLSVSGGAPHFLHDYGDADGGGLLHLHQRIRNVDGGGENGAAESTRRVDRIRRGSLDHLDMMTRARDRDVRRVGQDLHNLLPRGKHSGDAGMDFDLPTQLVVEGEMQLAGNHLDDLQLAWVPHLLRGEVECSIARFYRRQIDFRLNFIRRQLAD